MSSNTLAEKRHYVFEMGADKYFAVYKILEKHWPQCVMGGGTNLITGISDIHFYSDKLSFLLAIATLKRSVGQRAIKVTSYTEKEWNGDKE